MQTLFVLGEINKYLDTQIIEIESQPFWNIGHQAIKYNNLGRVLELSEYPRKKGMFEDMEEFQVYKTLCFTTDYQNKQLNKLVHLKGIHTIKCKLSMLCTSTSNWGMSYVDAHDLYDFWTPHKDYTEQYGSNGERDIFNKFDRAIEIQEAMVDNIEYGTKFIMEDKFDWHKQIKFISNDTMDYKKIETILNRDMLSIGF